MWTSQYVARSSDAHALYPVFVHRLARLLHASFRPRLATIALAFSLALHLHQVGRRTFTSKLLSMPSTHRHRGGGHPPTPATPPCVRVRTRRFDWLRQHSSNNDGSPSDLKYALESPTDRALARARYQGPRPLPAVLRASRSRTPSARSAARRRRGVFHCRHKAALSRNRTQRVKPISTSGVSQNPK